MFGKAWHLVKEHKYVFLGTVAVIVLVMYWKGSASGSAATTDSAGSDNSLQEAQLQAQTQIAGINAGSQAQMAQIAAGGHVAELGYQLQSDANQLNASIAHEQMVNSLQYLTSHDTLAAQIQNHQIDAALQSQQINTSAQTMQTRVLANALVQQAGIKAQAQTSVAQSQSCAWYNPTCW